jgi:hypothetical protein
MCSVLIPYKPYVVTPFMKNSPAKIQQTQQHTEGEAEADEFGVKRAVQRVGPGAVLESSLSMRTEWTSILDELEQLDSVTGGTSLVLGKDDVRALLSCRFNPYSLGGKSGLLPGETHAVQRPSVPLRLNDLNGRQTALFGGNDLGQRDLRQGDGPRVRVIGYRSAR